MKFNYSYRAFLLTSLLTGNLVLLLYTIKLSGHKEEPPVYDIEYAIEEMLPEEQKEEIAAAIPQKRKIETNRAYNEAEEFISKIESENAELTETTEGKMEAMSQAIADSKSPAGSSEISSKPKKKDKPQSFSNSNANKKTTAVNKASNRNTTISYQLVDRKAMDLPNPVYTCEGFGKVVIGIEVNATGRVTDTFYSKGASTTTNQCLIDSAMEYAAQARFSTDAAREEQVGTITFNFPGQW